MDGLLPDDPKDLILSPQYIAMRMLIHRSEFLCIPRRMSTGWCSLSFRHPPDLREIAGPAAERRNLCSPQRELWVQVEAGLQPRSGDISTAKQSRRRLTCRRSAAGYVSITI